MPAMECTSNTLSILFLFVFCHCYYVHSQPTVQNNFWRTSVQAGCDNNHNNRHPNFRSNGNVRLTGSLGVSDLQRSLDVVLLELQKHSVDTETLQQGVEDLRQRHDESRRLLMQLTESMNILVKKLVKNPACDCKEAGDAGGASGAGGGGGGGGGQRGGTDDDLDGYVKLFDSPPGVFSDRSGDWHEGKSGGREKVFMDQKGDAITSPQLPSDNAEGQNHDDETPRDLSVDQSRDETSRRDGGHGGGIVAVETTTSGTTTTTRSTTTAPDPIHRMYNGSVPKDCDDLRSLGYSRNGTYVIKPISATRSFLVLCEFHPQDVWTLIQRRLDGSVDFYRTWQEYKRGFGDLGGEFWIGNEVLHQLTNQDYYRLKIDMWEWPRVVSPQTQEPVSRYYFAESSYFFIDNETFRYEMHVPNDYFAYTGFGGSGLRIHAGPFLTRDVESLPEGMRENCAEKFHCGWWFTTCVRNANFNGRYYKGGYANMKKKRRARDDIYWPNIDQSLYRVVMKVGRVNESYAFRTYL